ALVFPFFALYVTEKFDVGMTQVGTLFITFSLMGMVGSTIGGALADRFGRKPIVLFSLVFSAAGNMTMALAPEFWMLFVIGGFLGLMSSIGGPARQAMLADLLPEEQRAEGFGVLRILFNVAVVMGPMIGGLLAGVSYLMLFSVDALASLLTATEIMVWLRETKPDTVTITATETLRETFQGYGRVLRDGVFMSFSAICVALYLVYFQMNTTLPVYLRDVHGIPPQGFGLIISINATMVVLMQVGITRRMRQRGYPQFLLLATGALMYAFGFGLYGVFASYGLFIVAMVIITLGEMIVEPVRYALATRLAPEDMRGRYMAVYGYGFAVASGGGTYLAGLVIDHLGPEYVWYFAAILGTLTALGYLWLHQTLEGTARVAEPAPRVPEGTMPAEAGR
ncbi:MAG: MFS transporter, partial [Anaerolineae bacterium]|nr:MFS transporter [Anaerolineae bacterium]